MFMAVGKVLAELVTSRCDRYQEEESKKAYEETEHSDGNFLVHDELVCGEGLLVTKARQDPCRSRMPNVRVTLVRLSRCFTLAPNAWTQAASKASACRNNEATPKGATPCHPRAWRPPPH